MKPNYSIFKPLSKVSVMALSFIAFSSIVMVSTLFANEATVKHEQKQTLESGIISHQSTKPAVVKEHGNDTIDVKTHVSQETQSVEKSKGVTISHTAAKSLTDDENKPLTKSHSTEISKEKREE